MPTLAAKRKSLLLRWCSPTGFGGAVLLAVSFLLLPAAIRAQEWNDDAVTRLVTRAIQRRAAARAYSGLRDYRARAHGFVLFLGQLGDDLAASPSLIKSDQLELEVYWSAGGASKQRIIGWRDRADLPTDIQYHRDHLGIVTNDFDDRIGLGHNDEVNDVPHPLSPDGLRLYDYALHDSLTIRLPNRSVRVFEVRTRPKSLDSAALVGSLFIDMASAALVRLRFNFTRSAYADPTLEDITVQLENGLWEGRYWLPSYQETEIRRRSAWFDLPARGIIRSRWTIDDYAFNVGTPVGVFVGPEIVALPAAIRDAFPWEQSLDEAIREAFGPRAMLDLDAVRAEVQRLAPDAALTGLPARRLGAASISDVLHFNRVEGLAPGVGVAFRPGRGNADVRLWGSYGLSDRRAKGRLAIRFRARRSMFELRAHREIRDVADEPAIAPLLNSLTAQEGGSDYGDYMLVESAGLRVRRAVGSRAIVAVEAGVERIRGVAVRASPVFGSFRPNPALGNGTYRRVAVRADVQPGGVANQGVEGTVRLESGFGEGTRYVRLRAAGSARMRFGGSDVVIRGWGGWGSVELPRHRSFVLGGRSSLVSEPFRVWGGRYGALGSVEWRLSARAPGIPLGPVAATDRIILAPFVAAGWTDGALRDSVPWSRSSGVRPVVGLGVEWLYGMLRTDVAVSMRDPRVGIVIDVRRDFWGVL